MCVWRAVRVNLCRGQVAAGRRAALTARHPMTGTLYRDARSARLLKASSVESRIDVTGVRLCARQQCSDIRGRLAYGFSDQLVWVAPRPLPYDLRLAAEPGGHPALTDHRLQRHGRQQPAGALRLSHRGAEHVAARLPAPDATAVPPRCLPHWPRDVLTAFGGLTEHPVIANGCYNQQGAEQEIIERRADLVSFGTLALANPDLPAHFAEKSAPSNPEIRYSLG